MAGWIREWYPKIDVGKTLCLLVGGFNPSEKYDFVSWDDDIPNIWKVIKNVPNHQPDHHHIPIVVGL